MNWIKRSVLVLAVLYICVHTAGAQDIPTIESKTDGFEKRDGFFPVYWDDKGGKVWLEIGYWDTDFLYVNSLPAGLGSNDIGLDRGLLGSEMIVQFERVGPRVLLVAPNMDYRAITDNLDEQKAVADAFATSVLWGFDVAAQTDDRVLVEATPFMMRDAMGVIRRLRDRGQGSFSLDTKRSMPYPEMTKAFPENTELEARLTFSSSKPGAFVQSVAADPYGVTLRMRQSLVKLPELGSYTPRAFDPRSGSYSIQYVDYAQPISAPKEVRYTVRHRLEKVDPNLPVSDPVEPIVYYLDRGTPEPIRSALLDGARWWGDAFEAAGFSNAYRVEMMPEGADPMDLRYNVIQWVHRSTRGWSYGRSVVDPRTGEILKGHVSLGSLRVRQDYLLAEGLLSPYDSEETMAGLSPDQDPMLDMALARLRQLSAHEIGHTLGFLHNFSASVNDRASVMDYPAPMVDIDEDGSLSLENAYDVGIGEWDIVTVRYAYSHFPESMDEKEALNDILADAHQQGYEFLSDTDARPQGGAHPVGHLWDNGADPAEYLLHELEVREKGLQNFGPESLPEGRPLAQMEEVLVPLYLHHRYQVEAAVKLVGGVQYTYALRGDQRPAPESVSAEQQLAALDAMLAAVTPDALMIPESARNIIPPRPPGYYPTRELFDGETGLIFDPYAPAHVVSQLVFGLIMHPDRAARLAYQKDHDSSLPGLGDVLSRVNNTVWRRSAPRDPYLAELQRVTQQVWTDILLKTVTSPDVTSAVRSRVIMHLRRVAAWMESSRGRGDETVAHRDMIYDDIARVLNRDLQAMETRPTMTTPPGSPIGSEPGFLLRTDQRTRWIREWTDIHTFCASE